MTPADPQPTWSLDRLVERVHPTYALLLALPWLIFLVNPNWMFQGINSAEAWHYFGLSSDFPRYHGVGEPLTWVLPARLFVAIFSPVYGWMLFHLCLFWASTLSLYYVVRDFAGTRTALIAAAMMAVHPFFLGANGWTYPDSGSITYFLLTLVALTASRKARRPWLYLVLAGALWAATAYTEPLWWALTPCCAFFLWGIADADPELRRWSILAACFAMGIALTTILMAGSLFGAPLPENVGGQNKYPWLASAGWILFPMLTFLVTLMAVIRHFFFGKHLTRPQWGLILAYVYAFLVMVLLTVRPNHILRFDYYANILIPLEFLVLGVLVFATPEGLSTTVLSFVLGAALVVSVAPLRRTVGPESNIAWHYVIGLIVIAAVIYKTNNITWAASVIGLAVACFGLAPSYGDAWRLDYNGLAVYRRVANSIEFIDANTPKGQYPVLWFSSKLPGDTMDYQAIAASLGTRLDDISARPLARYAPGTALILVDRDKNFFDTASAAAAQAGMTLQLRKQEMIFAEGHQAERIAYWLTVTTVLTAPTR